MGVDQLTLTLAQALEEIRAGVAYLVEFGRRMQENKRIHSWRWRSSTEFSKTFKIDNPGAYWTVVVIAVSGTGLISVGVGADVTPQEYTDGFYDLGTGGSVLRAQGDWVRIPTTERSVTVKAGPGLTLVDVVVVSHNGEYRLR